MLRATLKSLLARKLRLTLSALAVVLGVAFVSGAFVLTDSMGKAFDKLFADVNQGVAVAVKAAPTGSSASQDSAAELGTAPGVPASLLPRISRVDGVRAVEGSVSGFAQLVGKNGKAIGNPNQGPPTLGVNWSDPNGPLSIVKLESGRGPQHPGEIAIDAGLAQKSGYRPGDTAQVLTLHGQRPVTVVGIFGYRAGAGALGGATVTAFTTDQAQRLLGAPGQFSEIDVAADPGVSQAALRTRVAEVLPDHVQAVTGQQLADQQSSDVKSALSFFNTFLLIFAAIALFVGAFLIFNTFTMLVAQRTRELALMRALGASRGQVTRGVLVEAVIVGLIASAVGLGAGIGVAAALRAVFDAIGSGLPSGPFVVAPRTVLAAFLVGVVVTAIAALLPARKASAVPPVAAMRDVATPDAPLRRVTAIGVVAALVGCGLLGYGLTGKHSLWWLGIGALLAFIGVAALSPVLSGPVTSALGRLFAMGLSGRLGRQNAMRNPRRTAATAAALMIGLALVSAISVIGDSTKASVRAVVDSSVGADFIVDSQGPGFAPSLAAKLAKQPGVAEVAALQGDYAKIAGAGDPRYVTTVPPSAVGDLVNLDKKSGSFADFGPRTVLVAESTAKKLHVAVGDSLPVTFHSGGQQQFRVAAIYADNQLAGSYLFAPAVGKHFASHLDMAALVRLADGANADRTQQAITRATQGYANVQVQDRSEFVKQQTGAIDQIVMVIYVLLALSVIIAVLGIVNTLALSVIERTRELGLLRAIGMARHQVKRMIRVESVVIAVFGALLGLVVGGALGVAVTKALASQGVTELSFPVPRLLLFVVLAALAGVVAAWLPARRAARLNVLEAIATE